MTEIATDIGIWKGYNPFPSQRRFHDACDDPDIWAILLSGGFGGGKTMPASRQCFRWALGNPGSFGVVARFKATQLMKSTWRTFRRELQRTGLINLVEITGGTGNATPTVTLPKKLGGSTIMFMHLQNVEDLYGIEPDWAFVDEASEVPDNTLDVLMGRLRGTPTDGPGIENAEGFRVIGPLKIIFATNPGPSKVLRQRFAPLGVPGTPWDGHASFEVPTLENKTLPKQYIEFLKKAYTGARFKAFVLGDWSAFEGQLFTMWDADRHVVNDVTMRDLPGWTLIEGWDFGRAVDTAVTWLAYDPQGRYPKMFIGEYGAPEREVADHAREVLEMRKKLGAREVIVVGDPAGNQRGASGSYIQEYARHGIYISPCMMGRSLPVRDARMANELAATLPSGQPGVVICRSCVKLIDGVVQARYRTDRDDDPLRDRPEERVKKDDHYLDSAEYALMTAPEPMVFGSAPVLPDYLKEGVGMSSHEAFRLFFETVGARSPG